MLPDSLENMYPKWSDLPENQDLTLDNLIRDIIHNRLKTMRGNMWNQCLRRNEKIKKWGCSSSVISKEKNGNESTPIDDERAEVSNKKTANRKSTYGGPVFFFPFYN